MLTEEQLVFRRTGIGGSEISAVVGMNPHKSPLDVYLSKRDGLVEDENPDMERGRFLEPGLAAWYAYRESRVLLDQVGSLRHPAHSFAICTPDYLTRPLGSSNEAPLLLSIKCPGPFARDNWGEPETDDVPAPALLQLQWEMLIVPAVMSGVHPHGADLAAMVDGDLRIYRIAANPEIQTMLLDGAYRFWRDHVLPGKPPPIDGSESAKQFLSRQHRHHRPEMIEASIDDLPLLVEAREAAAANDIASERHELARNKLRERIGDARGIKSSIGNVSWAANRHGTRSLRASWKKQQ